MLTKTGLLPCFTLFLLLSSPLAGRSQDTVAEKPRKKVALESKVEYSAIDSLRFEIQDQKVFMFKETDLKYTDIELKADYVEIDFKDARLYAKGLPDSTGKESGIPDFKQGDQQFKAKTINYNYTTKKGYSMNVSTQQDEGFLHGQVVKKEPDNVTYMKSGWYTTCTNETHPHFAFRFTKAKVIPGKSVITGPAFLEIADVPTPLVIPFGYFPTRKGQRSGIIIPTYGESKNQGFFLTNGGYYFAFSKYFDLRLVGDIYSHGSWAIKPTVVYNVRYKFNGSFNFSYAYNRIGVAGTPNFQESRDYKIRWIHQQDKKARPKSNFSANVDIVSQNFNKYNPITNTQNYLSNTFQSSVNYSTNFGGLVYLNLNGGHSQNTLDSTITITLPQISLSVNQVYPFRKKTRTGKEVWSDKIGLRYNFDAQNRYSAFEKNLFKDDWYRQMQNGIKHSLPIGGTWRILKFFNFTNALNINDRMYFSTIRKSYIDPVITPDDTIAGYYKTDTVYGFANALDFSFSSGINTRLYGMYQFKGGPIVAIRHMMTPSVAISLTPDFGSEFWGYYRYITNDPDTINQQKYSIFQGGIYGTPPGNKSGIVTMSLANNLEMKVRNRKDTITGTKKVMLIDNFTFATSYDIAKDSMNWAPLTMSGRTTLFKNLQVQYNSSWDIYARDSLGRKINKTVWQVHHKLLQLDNTRWNLGLSYTLTSDKVQKKKVPSAVGTPMERQDIIDYYDNYVDFDIPWSFSINYNFNYTKAFNQTKMERVGKIVQTLGFNGQLNITPKWKITLTSGWDFTNHQLSFTSIDVYRDLHCWEMRFGWIPKGTQQSWNFSINVKASILQDMKLNKKKSALDYFE